MNNLKNDLTLIEAALMAKIVRKESAENDCETFWDEQSFRNAKKQLNLLDEVEIDNSAKQHIKKKMQFANSSKSIKQNKDKIISNAKETLYGYFATIKVIDSKE